MLVVLWAVALLAPSRVHSPEGLTKRIQEVANRTEELVLHLQSMRSVHTNHVPFAVEGQSTQPQTDALLLRIDAMQGDIDMNEQEITALQKSEVAMRRHINTATLTPTETSLFKRTRNNTALFMHDYTRTAQSISGIALEMTRTDYINEEILTAMSQMVALIRARAEVEKTLVEKIPPTYDLGPTPSQIKHSKDQLADTEVRVGLLKRLTAEKRVQIEALQWRVKLNRIRDNSTFATQALQTSADLAATAASNQTDSLVDEIIGVLRTRVLNAQNTFGSSPAVMLSSGVVAENSTGSTEDSSNVTSTSGCADCAFRPHGKGNFLEASVPFSKDLKQLSFMTWIQLTRERDSFVLFDISPPVDQGFTLVMQNCTHMTLNLVHSTKSIALPPKLCDFSTWHQFAVSWDSTGGEVAIFVDGKFRWRSWGVGAGATIPQGSLVRIGAGQKHGLRDLDLVGFDGVLRHTIVVSGVVAPVDIVEFSLDAGYHGGDPYLSWPMTQCEGSLVESNGTIQINATTAGGEWVKVETNENGVPRAPWVWEVPMVIDCSDPMDPSALFDPSTLQGPQGLRPLPKYPPRDPLVVPPAPNPYALPAAAATN